MTLAQILSTYAYEVAAVQAGEDLANFDELYDALFDHYCSTNEMPYGTAKARTGDPYEWITAKLCEMR